MALLTLKNIHLSYGHPPLLDGIDLSFERGERVCLLGRNGEGKSTLLKIIAAEIAPDEGSRVLEQGARVARLTQEVPEDTHGRVFDVVAEGLGDLAAMLKRYHDAGLALAEDAGQAALDRFARAQQALDDAGAWHLEQRVEQVLSRMSLDPDARFEQLSGGMKRRVLLARALAGGPDILLLDEPTNHLDIEAIDWLEEFLRNWEGTLIFVTHDRSFLRRLATRIVELDRGRASDWPGDYENYLRRREERDNAEAQANARLDKLLAQEEAWIRQGIKARRTRNEGRVRRLVDLRQQSGARRKKQGAARIQLNAAERSGKLLCEAVDVDYAWGDQPVIRGFSTTILRGDKVGIIGPNGCGKSTLLGLLLGRLKPDRGRVELGTKIEVAYFDQLREQLEDDKTVLENVAGGSDKVEINGKSKHVISYLQDFLFPPDRCRQPVRALSGGERNRLLLAKLFTRPANVLVLDEPTNDLDVETLELLEELLLEFDGTLLLVSHDRAFLDNVVTSTLVFEGEGEGVVNEYVGGYQDWLRQRPSVVTGVADGRSARSVGDPEDRSTATGAAAAKATVESASRAKKLSYKDQRELESLPQRIEDLEAELDALQTELADPDLYRQDPDRLAAASARMTEVERELGAAFERWESLDALAG